ncbi:serine hydrolase domain-containing protein [Actinomadura macrotermitis]|uniref:D-aminopeptidase n=1 Tax=Actinomadura macrotermitis TaxID=2585200 RepID=A0A7K0BTK5_9ACTN|nr:serine hydrolase domain-containing protein [Actinomadura macrotermitis]MQY04232.1 D-aminopeptidase [Actinomadura macrotermitis]
MSQDGLSRRDFGLIAGAAGLGATVLGGCSGAATAGRQVAAARTWRTTGTALAGLGGFDTAVKAFMQKRGIPAGQLAVVRKGRLVLARGYTWADAATPATQPTSLFRIASVSKPITATAVQRLIQDGRLKPTDRVATLLGLSTAADPRLKDVTVLRLLQHLGGWDRDISPDLMWQDAEIAKRLGLPLPIKHADIMRYASTRKLDHAPGTHYAYANYGYMLLGRIIEKASRQSYGSYVQAKVLAPRGIKRMRLGRTLSRAPGEVGYHSQFTGRTVMDNTGKTVASPYGSFSLENHDAQGGWLSTAVDLVRFAGIYDGGTSVLNTTSINRAFAKPQTGVNANGWYYGCGWMVRPMKTGRNTWHDGSQPGTSALLVRRYDGTTYAVLFDQRDDPSKLSYSDIDPALYNAANAVRTWPTGNLYSRYF